MSSPLLTKTIEDKRCLWLEGTNQYVVLEYEAFTVVEKLINGVLPKTIAIHLETTLSVPFEAALNFVKELEERVLKSPTPDQDKSINNLSKVIIPSNFEVTTTYQVNNKLIKVSYNSALEASYIHPKFAHLETEISNKEIDFKVFIAKDKIYLAINNKVKYGWPKEEIHYFQGKFSMEFIQTMYHKEESEWMGVFHASAVSNQQKAVLFLGDSGNGKSTSLALLQKHGFQCMADDFVPVAASNKEVYYFPAAISVKNTSLKTLAPLYPILNDTKEHHLKRLNKRVRYLPPNYTDTQTHLPCKDLVFIKYQKDVALSFSKISKQTAFEQLVPDSWLSPKKENATTFLEWFARLNCYQITYSQTNEMVASVSKIFNNDV
tara:strand:+ start:1134 stop:2264 length:1131 start_codon:yes stop_codon:yes gene_type:complete